MIEDAGAQEWDKADVGVSGIFISLPELYLCIPDFQGAPSLYVPGICIQKDIAVSSRKT
jgi:hypothetical protein